MIENCLNFLNVSPYLLRFLSLSPPLIPNGIVSQCLLTLLFFHVHFTAVKTSSSVSDSIQQLTKLSGILTFSIHVECVSFCWSLLAAFNITILCKCALYLCTRCKLGVVSFVSDNNHVGNIIQTKYIDTVAMRKEKN